MRAVFEVGERVSQGDGVMTKAEFISAEMGTRVTAHALHVGDRINTMNLEGEILSAVPLAIRVNKSGIAVLFRYGVAVLIGLSPEDEIGFLERLKPRIGGKLAHFEEETAIVALASEAEDQVQAGGPGLKTNTNSKSASMRSTESSLWWRKRPIRLLTSSTRADRCASNSLSLC